MGRVETDKLLQEVGVIAIEYAKQSEDAIAGRINAGEIAIMIPGESDPHKAAKHVTENLKSHLLEKWPNLTDIYQLVAIRFEQSSNLADILSKIDHVLAIAEQQGPNSSYTLESDKQLNVMPGEQWHTLITNAVKSGSLQLAFYPVLNSSGELLHQEGMVRISMSADRPMIMAGEFMPIVSHFSLTPLVDLDVVRIAINDLSKVSDEHIAINISADSIANWTFCSELTKLLRGHSGICSRLWLEVSEYGAFKYFDAFKDICFALKDLGCHVGIDQFGQRYYEITKITELGLDYVKLHSSLVVGIEENAGNQEFIRRFCEVVHTVGVKVIAVGVHSGKEWEVLRALGVDAVTGPFIVSNKNSI